MKLVIFGSRDAFPTHSDIDYALELLFNTSRFWHTQSVSLVISGTASGADRCGEGWARHRGILVERFPADWARYGRLAGPIRNRQMAETSDVGVGFWRNMSGGTANMVAQMTPRYDRLMEARPERQPEGPPTQRPRVRRSGARANQPARHHRPCRARDARRNDDT